MLQSACQGYRGDRHHQPARDHVVWERDTGKAIHRAIVWQDRRTASYCDKLKKQGTKSWSQEDRAAARPYFSGTKLAWMLDNVKAPARARAPRASLLRHGRQLPDLAADRRQEHATDATNASRTLLYNIARPVGRGAAGILRVPRPCCRR
jgi:glycerol kinase